MKLVFATHNPNKLAEIKALLPPQINLVSLTDIGCSEPIPETATTLKGNAKIKADYVTAKYGLPCFADDTGLIANALNGAPGVYSARYAGDQATDQQNMAKLLQELEGLADRSAYFNTVIALNLQEDTHYFEGRVNGTIVHAKRGTDGFGYDPLFMPDDHDLTFAELSMEQKNRISHRGKAFSKLIEYLTHATK